MKRRLFTPGPTPVPEKVLLAMAGPLTHHRLPAYAEIFAEVSGLLKKLFRTEQPVMTLTSSGTGTMEAAVANLLSPGDRAIVIRGGKFGHRWGEICERYGVEVIPLDVEWGKSMAPGVVARRLEENPDAKAVFATHCETSTGALFDVEGICRAMGASDALFVVDGITGIGVHDFRFDEWKIDAAVTGSQKGLMIPPGLGFIALSERAWEAQKKSLCPKYYFDLARTRDSLAAGQNPWTPAISLVIGLHAALGMIFEEGLDAIHRRHARLAQATRAAVQALGLRILAESPSNVLTGIWIPESADPGKFMDYIRNEMGVMVAGGQGHLKGKICRIAHVGYFDDFDVIVAIAALERALRASGCDVKIGSGVTRAQEELVKTY
jgi:aspartate aminotransferase-like enzyme